MGDTTFLHKGIVIKYHFPKKIPPKGLKIEPKFVLLDRGRGINGEILSPKKVLVAIDVYGLYDDEGIYVR